MMPACRIRGLQCIRQWQTRGLNLVSSSPSASQLPSTSSFLSRSFGQGWAFSSSPRFHSTDTDIPKTLQTVASWIQASIDNQEAPNILVLCGAGVSCAAGIPDFRTPGTGLYDNLQRYNLPYPEAIFDLEYFRARPQAFLSLAREIWPGNHSPTLTHSFLKLLEERQVLLRVYTQNIDGLEVLAGVSPDRIVECHGHFRSASCTRCGAEADITKVKQKLLKDISEPAMCERCSTGYIKPDIVFFGETLSDRMNLLLRRDLRKATLLLIMGTSLQVAPVSQIPEWVQPDCRRVLLNRELVGNLAVNSEKEDLVHLDNCDSSAEGICRALGWEEELQKQHKATKVGSSNPNVKRVS